MDRTLLVLKNGHELAKLAYHYDAATTGGVKININRLEEIEPGIVVVFPLYYYEIPVAHPEAFSTVEDIKTFDKELLAAQEHFAPYTGEAIDYRYTPVNYRYIVTIDGYTKGIANIDADFESNSKNIAFISAQYIGHDSAITSGNTEANVAAIRRMFGDGQDGLGIQLVDSRG